MKKIKILILGGKGQLGREFVEVLTTKKADLGNIDAVYKDCQVTSVDIDEIDICNYQQLYNKIKEGFDFVINCSGYTAVDKAEDDYENCYKVNTLGVQNLARICNELNTILVHFSTDYVFKGDSSVPYREYDLPCPATVYGKTKFLGEQYLTAWCPKHYLIRTSWLYGQYGKNFVYTMLDLAKTHNELKVVNDQHGSPTNANDLVYTTLKLIQTNAFGLYHCTGENECTWFEFTQKIMELSKIKIKITPVTSEEFKSRAKRPKYSLLDNLGLKALGLNYMRDWKVALKTFLSKIKEK